MSNISVSELLENLSQGFLDDLPMRVNKIEDEIMSSKESDTYDELFRMVHSLKGSAGSYNFHIITKIAHHMEDTMLALMQRGEFGTESTVNFLLKFIDILRETIQLLPETHLTEQGVDERLDFLRTQVFSESINVLVVEPSKLYVNMIEHTLQGLPINFTFVQDGLQALENLLLNKYDLLITSLESPRLNADAVVASLRLVHNFNRKIKVILITSRERDKIANREEFNEILDRKAIKEGSLKKIVGSMF
jgi:CheY-like chemotaxis protein/HPt (histidine-containing phosphotransfer) domain-containing protein